MKIAQKIIVPQETVNDEFVTISKIYFKTGDKVTIGQTLIDIETSKAVLSIDSETGGFVKYLCDEGSDVAIGATIVEVYDSFEQSGIETAAVKSVEENQPLQVETIFSKSALQLIEKEKIDKNLFIGKDFIDVFDIRKIINPDYAEPEKQAKPSKNIESSLNNKEKLYGDKIILKKLSKSKRTEISYLSEVQSANMNSIANVYVNLDGVFDFTNDYFSIFKNSILPIVVYESSRLLKKYPEFNCFFLNGSVAYYEDINIGIAVDIDDGLKVVKISNPDKQEIREIENNMMSMVNKYLDKKLEIDDITGTTFSITDLSIEGVNFFSPLINKDQSAILGISAVDDKLDRCVLTLAFDHRITEGKKAGAFLRELKTRIESYRNNDIDRNLKKLENLKCGMCFKSLIEDKQLKGIGLVKVIDHEGKEKHICNICLTGYNQ